MGDKVGAPSPSPENTRAVIVTFHPGPALHQTIETIVAQVRGFVIVDNHSDTATVDLLRALCAQFGGDLIANEINLGVAEAIDQGLDWARAQGAEWALLFDQDSLPFSTLLCDLASVYADYPDRARIGVLAPNLIERGTGRIAFEETLTAGARWIERSAAITSGSLVSLAAAKAVGGMRREFFIDMVDFEFSFRLLAHGYHIVASTTPLMLHSVGRYERRTWLGISMWVTNHPPRRRYYIARNEVVVMKEQWRARPRWVRSLINRRMREVVKIVLVEDEWLAKLGYIARGVWDGLRGSFDYSPLRDSQ